MASRCSFPSLGFRLFSFPSLAALLLILGLSVSFPDVPLPNRPDLHASLPDLPGGRLSFKLPSIPSIGDLILLLALPFSIPELPFGLTIKAPSVPSFDLLLELLLSFVDFPELPHPHCFLDDLP
jgi:hypothetical protein